MKRFSCCNCIVFVLAIFMGAAQAKAQWDPANGLWGKSDPNDVRVMTWNVRDHICSTNDKSEGITTWCCCARIVALLKPVSVIIWPSQSAPNTSLEITSPPSASEPTLDACSSTGP